MFFFWYFKFFASSADIIWHGFPKTTLILNLVALRASTDYGIVYVRFCTPRKFCVKQGGALYSPTFIFDPIRYFHFWLLGLFKGVCCRCSCTDQPSTLRGDFSRIGININFVKMIHIAMILINCTSSLLQPCTFDSDDTSHDGNGDGEDDDVNGEDNDGLDLALWMTGSAL